MIRFPERFHASVTPGAAQFGVEPNYLDEPARSLPVDRQRKNVRGSPKADAPNFDFTAINAVMGR